MVNKKNLMKAEEYRALSLRYAMGEKIIPLKKVKNKKVRRDNEIPISSRLDFLKRKLEEGFWQSPKVVLARRENFNRVKDVLLPLEGKLCYCCGDKATERHHILPLYKGGKNKIENLVPLCKSCHCKLHPYMLPELYLPAEKYS